MNVFQKQPPSNGVNLAEPLPTRLLRHRLKRIDEALADLPATEPDGSYRTQEIESLRADLRDLRRTTEIAIANATTSKDLELAARNETSLDIWERERVANKRRFLAKLEAEGDWRHYRIHFVELVLARESLAKEYRLQD